MLRGLIVAVFTLWPVTAALAEVWPGARWETASPAEAGMDEKPLEQARDYALSGGGSGYIVRGGRLVMRWGSETERYDIKSSTKSFGVTALGVAIHDGKLALDDLAIDRHTTFGVPPAENVGTGWIERVTLRHLVTQTAGFDKVGGYEKLLFEPGTKWSYSDGGPNWLAECVTLAYGRDLDEWMFERVFTPIGITRDDLVWRANRYRDKELNGVMRREFGSGIHANVNALARVGLLYLRGGRWRDLRILPRDFAGQVGHPQREVMGLPGLRRERYGRASDRYGMLFWTNGDGSIDGVPRDAFWSWGLYDSLMVIIPSLDLVVARAGSSFPEAKGGEPYGRLAPFLRPIAASVRAASAHEAAPYPASRAIVGVAWAPLDAIRRAAPGGDNWPMTWGDDDQQYTAYGDARGFEPFVPEKLGLGIARVSGAPGDFHGQNIDAPSIENRGQGAKGAKASGMLMVDGALHMLLRNAGNSRLATSRDHGQTWTQADWKFERSFGAPTFLNFGRDYDGARDEFVYIYSHDGDSAYVPADRMVLARVPRGEIADHQAYEFFAGLNAEGAPRWTRDIELRGPVFEHQAACCRSGISYNAGLKRYLWCQVPYSHDARWEGGFAIYESREPWGPWSTVFYTDDWDTGPGETNSFPTKWMSEDGRVAHLVFSGDDAFSVRRAEFAIPATD